jgi:CxxC motif-containing protein
MKNSTINKIKALLGMEVKLEQMKLADGTTVLEADAFEMDNEVFVVTPDEQKIPLPVGEYELENGMILVIEVEGIIKEVKEAPIGEEVAPEEQATPEVPVEAAEEVTAPKKTVESIVKETFFSEIEALKNENIELKAKLELLSKVEEVAVEATKLSEEPKPIMHNPENTNQVEVMKFAKQRTRTTLDSIFEKLNK